MPINNGHCPGATIATCACIDCIESEFTRQLRILGARTTARDRIMTARYYPNITLSHLRAWTRAYHPGFAPWIETIRGATTNKPEIGVVATHRCSECKGVQSCYLYCGQGHQIDFCEKCNPDAWKVCGGCCNKYHSGFCLKCNTWYQTLDRVCLACGKDVKTRRIRFETCKDCSRLPFAVTRSMIRERQNRVQPNHAVPTRRCHCNKCRGS